MSHKKKIEMTVQAILDSGSFDEDVSGTDCKKQRSKKFSWFHIVLNAIRLLQELLPEVLCPIIYIR